MRFGQAFWPGVTGFISCSYTVSHDIGAGIASLVIPEQNISKIPLYGTLTITDGAGTISLRRCKIMDVQFDTSSSGRTITLSIADRRWMWRFGAINGSWNQIDQYPDPDSFPPGDYTVVGGIYQAGTVRSVHLLMADCLAEMGESKFLINPSPITLIPVQWEEENPASALSSLADQVGYRVVYQPVKDRVLVSPAGRGGPLSAEYPSISYNSGLSLPGRPNAIAIAGGPTIWHDWLRLEPVGLEKDGTVKHIDKLSYRPANGWSTCNPQTMPDVRATLELTEEESRELAMRYVWRTFRVRMVDVATGAEGPNIGGFGRITDRKQLSLLPMRYFGTKKLTGEPDTEPAFCVGEVFIAGESQLAAKEFGRGLDHTTRDKRLPWSPTINTAQGLVSFSRQMFKILKANGQTQILEPPLYLYTGFTIRSLVGLIPVKWRTGGITGNQIDLGCPAEVINHPELVEIRSTLRKSATDFSITSTASLNYDELLAQSNAYLQAADAKYAMSDSADAVYSGIIPIDPDGAIQQVSWSVGAGSPAITRVSRNREHAIHLPSFAERRRVEDTRRFLSKSAAEAAKKNNPAANGTISKNEKPPGEF